MNKAGEEKDRHHYVTGLDGKGREFTWVWGRKGRGSGTATRPELLLTHHLGEWSMPVTALEGPVSSVGRTEVRACLAQVSP